MNRKFYVNFKNILCINIFRQISLILIFGIALIIQAAPGDLDTTFNGTGKFRGGFGGGDDRANAMAIQSDGKYIVVGSSVNAGHTEFAVARYNTDGSLDPTFDGDGKAFASVGSGDAFANAVAIQADGKIVVAGYQQISGSDSDFALVRFNSDGSLDASFDGDGKVTTSLSTQADEARAIAIQTDGKIVAAGRSDKFFALARYNTDGSLDASFDSDGIVLTDIGGIFDQINAIAFQSGGKIIVAGYSFNGGHDTFALARYNTNGSLDTSFDGDGKVTTLVGLSSEANAIAIQTSSTSVKIIAAGSSIINSNSDFALVRYNTNGSLDTTFDGDGKLTTPIGAGNDAAEGLQIIYQSGQPSGIIAAGYGCGSQDTNCDFAVTEYLLTGALDTTFGGGDGKVTTAITAEDRGSAMTIQAGKIIVAGYTAPQANAGNFALVRYNANGSLDTSFDRDGRRTDDVNEGSSVARSVAIQADGKIVVAGYAETNSIRSFAVARYNTDGTFDASFSNDGKVKTSVIAGESCEANAVAIQPGDGKIVVSGKSGNNFAVARYNTDGSLDATFDADGVATTVINTNSVVNALAIQTDGKIVAAGNTYNVINGVNGASDFAVVRYLSNGSPDSSFGSGGKVITAIGADDDEARAVKIQTDGKIVVAGYSTINTTIDITLARYNTNGTLDSGFGSFGRVATDFGGGGAGGFGMAIQTDGKIVVTGVTTVNSDFDFAVARYLINGSLDSSFGSGGKVITPIGIAFDVGNAATIQTDGKIIIAGVASVGNVSEFAVVRYNSNGSLDNSYGTGGKVVIDVGGNDQANAIALDSSGKAVIAGDAGGLFGVVRLLGDAPLSQTYEGDVQSRPNGDGFVDSDDIQQIRQFSVGSGLPYQSNEFQRADCSPRSTSGDGFVDGDDVQQARRFSVGTDGNQIAGGPTSIAPPADSDWFGETLALPFGKQPVRTRDGVQAAPAAFRVDNQNTSAGATLVVPIRVDTVGNEAGYTFSIAFDSTKLTNPIVTIGSGGGDVVFNANNPGQIGFSVTSFSGGTIAAGNNVALVNVTFTAAAGAPAGMTPITFTDTPARRKASGVDPNNPIVQPTYTGGTITISGATAAGATVSGRVLTADGRGIRNAMVTITGQNGETRTVLSSAFGYFRFADIPAGQTYIIGAKSKRFKFAQATRVLNLSADVVDVNFIAVE